MYGAGSIDSRYKTEIQVIYVWKNSRLSWQPSTCMKTPEYNKTHTVCPRKARDGCARLARDELLAGICGASCFKGERARNI